MPVGFLSTVSALEALQAKLKCLRIGNDQAFVTVALYDMSNLLQALTELIAIGDRVCLIVHDQERFDNARAGRELRSRQMRDVMLLIADRNVASRQKALFGDPASVPPQPGVLALKDLILNHVVGLLQPGLYCQPMHGEQMVLEKKIRDELQGRVVFTMGLQIVGGNVIVDLGQQPIP